MRLNVLRRSAIVPTIVVTGYTSAATWTLDTAGLSDITGYEWRANGVATGHTTASPPPLTSYIGQRLSCVITYDSGGASIETPAQKVHMLHADVSHNMHDDMLLSYVKHNECNYIARQDGDWSNPATWYGGRVPNEDSQTLIPWGTHVTLDVDDPNFRHDRVRLDGILEYAQDSNVNFLVHTIIGEQDSILRDGTAMARLPDQYQHTTYWADRAPRKDKSAATRPDIQTDIEMMTGGYVTLGVTDLWGRERAVHNLARPMAAGSTQAVIVDPRGFGRPALFDGLRVNDRVVIAGTKCNYQSGDTSINADDEERTITGIQVVDGGHVLTFDTPLTNNHTDQDAGRADCFVPIMVIKSANIAFGSVSTAPNQGGHFMMMHGACEIDIWDCDFFDMGRTSKKKAGGVVSGGQFKRAIEGNTELVDLTDESNVIGRYSGPHAHRTGRRFLVEGTKRREIHGCAVYDAIGFGFVHHDCHLNLFNSGVYKFWGTAFVAEQGSETGAWVGLCAIGTTNNPSDPDFEFPIGFTIGMKVGESFLGIPGDVGRGGWGAYLRSRAVRIADCVFASCNTGVVWFMRTTNQPSERIASMLPHYRDSIEFVYAGAAERNFDITKMSPEDVPIRHADNIRTLGCVRGHEVSKSNANQHHDNGIIWSNLIDFGSLLAGIMPEYVGTYGLHWCQVTNAAVGINWQTNIFASGNVNCQTICDTGVLFHASADPTVAGDGASAADFRWHNICPIYDCSTVDETGDIRGDSVHASYTDIRHLEERYDLVDWSFEPYTTFPRKYCDWDGGATLSNQWTNADGNRVDRINGAAEIAPKWWFGGGDRTGFLGAGQAAQWKSEYGFFKVDGRDCLLWPLVVSARDTNRHGFEWHTVEATTLDGFGGTGDPDYQGVFTFSANPVVQPDIFVTCAKGGSVVVDVTAGATGGDGTISTLDPHGNRIVRQSNNGEMTWAGDTVTFTPDASFYGATYFVVVLHSAGQTKTVHVNVLVDTDEGQEVPVHGTHFQITGGAGKFDLALLDKPNAYPRRCRDVVYSTDAGTTWRLAAIDWSLHTFPITRNSDGTPLTAGTTNVLVKYVTDHDRLEISAASQPVTIT